MFRLLNYGQSETQCAWHVNPYSVLASRIYQCHDVAPSNGWAERRARRCM